jgi:hypothetical protein
VWHCEPVLPGPSWEARQTAEKAKIYWYFIARQRSEVTRAFPSRRHSLAVSKVRSTVGHLWALWAGTEYAVVHGDKRQSPRSYHSGAPFRRRVGTRDRGCYCGMRNGTLRLRIWETVHSQRFDYFCPSVWPERNAAKAARA